MSGSHQDEGVAEACGEGCADAAGAAQGDCGEEAAERDAFEGEVVVHDEGVLAEVIPDGEVLRGAGAGGEDCAGCCGGVGLVEIRQAWVAVGGSGDEEIWVGRVAGGDGEDVAAGD